MKFIDVLIKIKLISFFYVKMFENKLKRDKRKQKLYLGEIFNIM